MGEGRRNTDEIERDAAPREGSAEVKKTDLGPVADPDAEQPGESRVDRSAEKADPTV